MPEEPIENNSSFEVPSEPQPPMGRHSLPPVSPWRLIDLAFFLLFTFIALLASNFLVFGGYMILAPHMGWPSSPNAVKQNPFLLLTLQTVFYGFILLYIYFLIVNYYKRPFWASLNWRYPTRANSFRFLLGGCLLAICVRFAPTILPDTQHFPLERLFSSATAGYAIGAFAILVAPFMEELIFRGVLFAIFEKQAGLSFAIGITALLFAGLHVPEYWGAWNHVFLIFLVGIVLSLARGLTRSLVPSVILHVGYNASMVAFFIVASSYLHRGVGG